MAEGEKATSKIAGFLSKDTAGLPNWAWIVVVGAGLAAAYIIPKFMNKGSQNQASTGTDSSGLGLAIDPTTGLPYAVEGLVPSGGLAGSGVVPGPSNGSPPPPPNNCAPLGDRSQCPAGQMAQQGTDSNGCPVWKCVPCPPHGAKPKCPSGCHAAYETDANGCKKWACHKNCVGSPCPPCTSGSGTGTNAPLTNTGAGGGGTLIAAAGWPNSTGTAATRGMTPNQMATLNPQINPATIQPGQPLRTS